MGTIFKHVDDNALRTCGGDKCQFCERNDVPVYSYPGRIINPSLAANPDLAKAYPEVDELCAQCINSGNVHRRYLSNAEKIIKRFARDESQAWVEFHQLPDVPLFLQGFDWPMCCGRWADFTGSPETMADLIELDQRRVAWEGGPIEKGRDFKRDGPPESLNEISLFRCWTCGRGYYVDQFT
jgi:hypothetical protein